MHERCPRRVPSESDGKYGKHPLSSGFGTAAGEKLDHSCSNLKCVSEWSFGERGRARRTFRSYILAGTATAEAHLSAGAPTWPGRSTASRLSRLAKTTRPRLADASASSWGPFPRQLDRLRRVAERGLGGVISPSWLANAPPVPRTLHAAPVTASYRPDSTL